MTHSSPLGLMSEGERLALELYLVKNSIPLSAGKPYVVHAWTITVGDYWPLNFSVLYEITKRNYRKALEERANCLEIDVTDTYTDRYGWNENSWSFPLKIELSPAAQKIMGTS
ncbi:hypothetical protein [Curvivirga sp.]|uniref:hypothetical protein n=1 Tax=Curvivirga sp. TaxID=2856848 RepID=UPI003B58CFBF